MNTSPLYKKKQKSFTPLNAALRQFRQKRNYLTGFTLIEFLVVISIFGLLASVIIVSMQSARDKARIAKALTFSATLKHSLGDALVGEWRFEEGGDNTCGVPPYDDFCDVSDNGNHGKKLGNPSRAPNEISQLGKAGLFNGDADRIEIADSNSLDLTSGITIEVWVRVDSLLDPWQIVRKGAAYGLFIDSPSPKPIFYIVNEPYSCSEAPFVEKKWHHYVGSYNGSKQEIFVDGKEICSRDKSDNITQNNDSLMIVGNGFYGGIDEVRIYSRGLTQAEIQKHYVEGAEKRGIAVE